MAQPLVLAIEPDLRQAAIVKRIVREQALAEVAVVDSRDAAIEAMRTRMPDVLLLSALMSPRDEDELIAHLKTLENAGHLQTHTIPQLASSLGPGEERASGGLLSAFRRKKDPAPVVPGCDPDLFAEEIRVFLQRAADKKSQQQSTSFTAFDMRPSATASTRAAAAPADEPAADAPSSAWSSPFEWKPSGSSARATRAPEATPAPAPPAARPLAAVPIPEPSSPEPSGPLILDRSRSGAGARNGGRRTAGGGGRAPAGAGAVRCHRAGSRFGTGCRAGRARNCTSCHHAGPGPRSETGRCEALGTGAGAPETCRRPRHKGYASRDVRARHGTGNEGPRDPRPARPSRALGAQ